MRKHIALFIALFSSVLAYAGDFGGMVDIKGASAADALSLYSKLSNLELSIEPAVTNVYRTINLSIQSSSKKDVLTAFESALHDQANIVITKLDDKHASVTLDKK